MTDHSKCPECGAEMEPFEDDRFCYACRMIWYEVTPERPAVFGDGIPGHGDPEGQGTRIMPFPPDQP